MLKTIVQYTKPLYILVLFLSFLPLLWEGVSFPTYLYFFIVIASSSLPVIAWLVKRRPFILNDLFGRLLVFRVLTDLSCVLTDFILHNSNPTFFFSLPINGILILMLFHKHLQTKFSKRFFNFSIVCIAVVFIYQLLFISMYSNDPIMNLLTYSLTVFFGIYSSYHSIDRRFINFIVFPLCMYYAPLIFYSLFEIQIHSSAALFNHVFLLIGALTLGLNVFFCRTVWLGRDMHTTNK